MGRARKPGRWQGSARPVGRTAAHGRRKPAERDPQTIGAGPRLVPRRLVPWRRYRVRSLRSSWQLRTAQLPGSTPPRPRPVDCVREFAERIPHWCPGRTSQVRDPGGQAKPLGLELDVGTLVHAQKVDHRDGVALEGVGEDLACLCLDGSAMVLGARATLPWSPPAGCGSGSVPRKFTSDINQIDITWSDRRKTPSKPCAQPPGPHNYAGGSRSQLISPGW